MTSSDPAERDAAARYAQRAQERVEERRRFLDWQRRVVRQGYLFQSNGDLFRVPRKLYDLFREQFPDVGLDDDGSADDPHTHSIAGRAYETGPPQT